MPVTKKKGAIFAIYADSPIRSSGSGSGSGSSPPRTASSFLKAPGSPSKRAALGSTSTSTSTSTKNARNGVNGKGNGSMRTVLSSLQPTAIKPSSSSSTAMASLAKSKSSKEVVDVGGPLKSKSTSTIAVTTKSKIQSRPKSTSQIMVFADEPSKPNSNTNTNTNTSTNINQKSKPRAKSTLSVFSDENLSSAIVQHEIHTKTSSSSSVFAPQGSRSRTALGVKNDDSQAQTQISKSRRTAASALAPLQPQSLGLGSSTASKRPRDLLSPLPILAPAITTTTSVKATETSAGDGVDSTISPHTRTESTGQVQVSEVAFDPIGESPAKRNRTSFNAATPQRASRVLRTTVDDKENVPPTSTTTTTMTTAFGLPGTPDDLDGSPATRTRSKIRALTISSGSPHDTGVSSGSPLRSSV
ncbi:hypothetical protein IAU59_005738 [Kwoniella sp. CBS 9459]